MGSGLSMASVNKIKELANSREYSLALDIIESQDLSKSLNPQFLRLCGEIYMKTGHYREARRVLLMAHRLAPEAKRIIYSFVELYLRAGYKSLADTYYEMYLFDADESSVEAKQIKYIYAKANDASLDELEDIIAPIYSHTMDYDWSFEVFLIFMLQTKADDAVTLATEFTAMFKNSDNCRNIEDIANGRKPISDFFDVFAKETVSDDAAEDEELREEEKKLLEADELRMHPKEAEITIIFDDREEENTISKRKLKKLLKEQEKEQEKEQDAQEDEVVSDENSVTEESESVEVKKNGFLKKVLTKVKRSVKNEDSEQAESELESVDVSASDTAVSENLEPAGEIVHDETVAETVNVTEESVYEEVNTDDVSEEKESKTTVSKTVESETAEFEEAEISVSEFEDPENETEECEISGIENISNSDTDDVEKTSDISDVDEDSEMREIHLKQHKSKINPIVSVDLDDDFTAESDTIDELKDDADYGNPFESISAIKKEKEEHRFVLKPKTEIVFEDARIAPEEHDCEFEVDDFSVEPDMEFESTISDVDEFNVGSEQSNYNKMQSTDETLVVEREPETDYVEEHIEESEVAEEISDDEPEAESETDSEEDIEEPETAEEISEDELEAEPETDSEEECIEEPEIAEEISDDEPEAELETDSKEDIEESEVAEGISEVESEPGPEIDSEEECIEEPEVAEGISETEIEAEPKTDSKEECIEEPQIVETTSDVENESEPEYEQVQFKYHNDYESKKKKLDFPVFKSSLFPEYHQEIEEVENNFNEIMNEAQDKFQENKRKEEQMLKEAEELLASMGIHLDDVNVTSNSMESIGATLYNEPSRDELKESLKIDSVKKDLLNNLREYR